MFEQINLFYPIYIDKTQIVYFGILFKIFKETPNKNTTKREKINFTDKNDLLVAWLGCNNTYKLQKIKESLEDFL